MPFTPRLTKVRFTAIQLYGEPSASGAGTVTEIDAGADITLAPSPIVGVGSVGVTPNTFVRADGTQPLTAAWDAGNFNITSRNSMPMFNMLEYGANPNGVFDNTAVLTAIHADLPANGGIIVVPNGTCYVASTVTFTKPAWFVGVTPDSSYLSFRDNGDGLVFTHAGGQAIRFVDVGLLVNAGGGGTSGALVHCASAANFPLIVDRCYFGNYFDAINMESNWFSAISESRFAGAHGAAGGSSVVVNNLVNEDQGDLHINGCTFTGTSSYGVRQRAGGGTTLVNNKFISGSGHVASVLLDLPAGKTTGDLIITANSFEGEPSTASIVLAPDGLFTNVLIESNEIASFPSVTAIQVVPSATGTCRYGVVAGNTMWQGDYAVEFGPGQVGGADIWRVDGNVFSSQVVAAIKLPAVAARVANLTVGQNQFVQAGGNVYVSGSFSATSGFDNVYVGTGASTAGSVPWSAPVTVNRNAAPPPAVLVGTGLHVVGEDGVQTRVCLDSFAGDGRLNFRRASGSGGAPAAVAATTDLGGIAAFGYGTTGYSSTGRASISAYAGDTWTDAAQGTGWDIKTTPFGGTATATKVRIDPDGKLLVGTTAATTSKLLVNGTVELVGGSGGGYKFADGSIQTTAVGVGGACPSARIIATTAPLAGGGNLTADRTLSLAVTPANAGGAVALQGVSPGTQQTGNLNLDGVVRADGGFNVTSAASPSANYLFGSGSGNGDYSVSIGNSSNGTGAEASYILNNDLGQAKFKLHSSGYTGTGAEQAGAASLIADANNTGGLSIGAQANAALRFYTGGISASELRVTIKGTGIVNIANLPAYANNAAATGGGLVAGDLYCVAASDPRQVAVVF